MAMAQRPLVRAYGIVTGEDDKAIREVEKAIIRGKMSRDVIWFERFSKASKSKVSYKRVEEETPVFAKALQDFSKTDVVTRRFQSSDSLQVVT